MHQPITERNAKNKYEAGLFIETVPLHIYFENTRKDSQSAT